MYEHTEKTQHSQQMSEEYEPGLVSVIIPTYNRADLVREAIQSVLDQTYQNFEIIVVDDGSTDGTEQVLAPYKDRIIYIYQENQGGAAARNTGIKVAKGEYIAFLDSDDLWFPQKLEKQVEILDKNQDISVVYSNIIKIDENNKIIGRGSKDNRFLSGYIFREVLLRKAACAFLQTLLVRKICFEEIGYFDEKLKKAHDRDMILRLAQKYKMYGIKEPLAKFRIHNLTPRLATIGAGVIEHYDFRVLDKLFSRNGINLNERLKKRIISNCYLKAGLGYLRKENNYAAARNRFWLSIYNNPCQLKTYMYFLATLMGKSAFKVLNQIRKLVIGAPNYFHKLRHEQKCQ